MTTSKFNITECGLAKSESRNLIVKLLNDQIAECRRQHQADWERDHSISFEPTLQKIEALKAKKQEIESFFNENEYSDLDNRVDVDISIEVKVNEPMLETA